MTERAAPTDAYRLARALILILVLVTLDMTKFLDKGTPVRYLILLVPIGAYIAIRARRRLPRFRRPRPADKVLMVLTVIGLAGSLYGRLVLHTGSSALPIFLPMLTAFLYLGTLQELTPHEVRKILGALASVGLLYVSLNALANSSIIPALKASRAYRNADISYIAMGFVGLMVIRRWGRFFLFAGLAAFVFVTYPSATFAIVMVVGAVTVFVTRPDGSHLRMGIAAVTAVVIIVVALFSVSSTVHLADSYFSAVGKRNNTNTRLALWNAGLVKFTSSPVYGDFFSGETTVLVARRPGGGALFKNPYNNDYLLFAASGGSICLGLLLAWILLVEVDSIKRYRRFIAAGDHSRAALLRVLLVTFNAWLTAAAFNPLFQGMGRSVTLFAIYGLMMLLGRPARQPILPAGTRSAGAAATRPVLRRAAGVAGALPASRPEPAG